jgi:hypothetical protein
MCANQFSGNLNLVWLNSSGQLLWFNQTSDGVWHAPTPAAIAIPAQTSFAAIKGIDGDNQTGAVLLAIDSSGELWVTTQDSQDNRNPGGFTRLPAVTKPVLGGTIPYMAVDAAWVEGVGLVIAAIAGLPIQFYLFVMSGAGPGALSAPTNVSQSDYAYEPSIAVAGTGNTAVVVTTQYVPSFNISTSGNGLAWTLPPSPATTEQVATIALTIGAGQGAPLQMLSLDKTGALWLFWDDSGNGSNWVPYPLNNGQLPTPAGVNFSKLAAKIGGDGNLQVVLLGLVGTTGAALPYLVWQWQGNGSWSPYSNPGGQGAQLPVAPGVLVTDLAIGIGGQNFLQVGYIGVDQKIYVNWQDDQGNWAWYGPLP